MATLTDNAITILKKRYLAKNEQGDPSETPDQMFRRVAKHVAQAESDTERDLWEKTFYQIMSNLEFLPNTPCLVNAGRPFGMLSACFVLPLEDSLEEIYQTIHEAVMVQKMGGGTGFPLHNLRPNGDMVRTTGHRTAGPIAFLKVIDANMEIIRQGGVRHGANMAVMRVDHPDIEEFIDCKAKEGHIRNFNISVGTTDAFIMAVKHDSDWNLVNPRDGRVMKTIKARGLWRKVAEGAWRNGEPGVIYLDEMNRHHPTPEVNKIETTNPCGEQGLPPYDSCNLGSINLNAVLRPGTAGYSIDYEKLAQLTETCTRFLDDVITVNRYPIEKIAETSRKSRRIGLGIMGLADVLLLMRKKYDSEDGRDESVKIMRCINDTAHQYSRKLAVELTPFPLCDRSVYKNDPHRNATLTTIAPTGSISAIANCSSGCEPHFAIAFEKHILDGAKLLEVNQAFQRLAEEEGFWSKGLHEQLMEHGGDINKLKDVPEWVKNTVRVSSDISAMDHIKMQAALQPHVDNSISKTINAPNDITVEEVEKMLMFAHEWGCRGLTFYREGSRQEAVLVKPKAQSEPGDVKVYATNGHGKTGEKANTDRPKVMHGSTHKVRTGYGSMYVTVNRDDTGISELFVTTNDTGGEFRAWTEFASRIASYALRMGLKPDFIVKAGKHIRGPKPVFEGGGVIMSGPDAVAKILEKELGVKITVSDSAEMICPDCSSDMVLEEGCKKCYNCGYAACGG